MRMTSITSRVYEDTKLEYVTEEVNCKQGEC